MKIQGKPIAFRGTPAEPVPGALRVAVYDGLACKIKGMHGCWLQFEIIYLVRGIYYQQARHHG